MTNDTNNINGYSEAEFRYLKLLADRFPNIQSASAEIINAEAILTLPKGTEHFLTDIHGEYETFSHFLRNASGVVRRKIDDVFGNRIRESEKRRLATLIYYPDQKLELLLKEEKYPEELYSIALQRLVEVARSASTKYTRSKVRKALPPDFAYIIDELLNESAVGRKEYFNGIIQTIINIKRAKEFIIALCHFIQRMLIDRLHIIGDIYDRGPAADRVMDALLNYHSVDIQWGNHDIIWMGAAAGSPLLIATVLRISARYDNLDTIEDAYGINLMPLATFALQHYQDDPCTKFIPRTVFEEEKETFDTRLIKQMHKAISIIQFKLEAQAVLRNPDFNMNDRTILDKINFQEGTIQLYDKKWELNDTHFPTISPDDPFSLSEAEKDMMERLVSSFLNSRRLQKHIEFLYAKGSMFLTYNGNLMYHGCIPLDTDGSFSDMKVGGKTYAGRNLLEQYERIARRAYLNRHTGDKNQIDADWMWYLWCGSNSPLFGKRRMTTFERYFINDKASHDEPRNAYYKLRENEGVINNILLEFDLEPKSSHIINGHTPVKVIKGESPVRANGRLLVIDGGMSSPYQKVTGIAGYTLIYNSFSLVLAQHAPFESRQQAIEKEVDIITQRQILEEQRNRIRVGDTDIGKEIMKQINDLKALLDAYRSGIIKEK
ncbi:MAG: fructose-1,6-bisphosphatase [Bacteroidales bacterium]|nr:fructose-1,6-bisphosphatase [Bacteroidales bacterium]